MAEPFYFINIPAISLSNGLIVFSKESKSFLLDFHADYKFVHGHVLRDHVRDCGQEWSCPSWFCSLCMFTTVRLLHNLSILVLNSSKVMILPFRCCLSRHKILLLSEPLLGEIHQHELPKHFLKKSKANCPKQNHFSLKFLPLHTTYHRE